MDKDYTNWKREDFMKLKHREWDEEVGPFDSIVIIPGYAKALHDSGYRTMYFVGINDNKPTILMSGCSDVINLDGIGGYGKRMNINGLHPLKDINIDCLPNSGFFRIFSDRYQLEVGSDLSSFSIYFEKERKK